MLLLLLLLLLLLMMMMMVHVVALCGYDIESLGIPSLDHYCDHYTQLRSMKPIDNWNFYMAYVLFRTAAIVQGVYKRFTLGLLLSVLHNRRMSVNLFYVKATGSVFQLFK